MTRRRLILAGVVLLALAGSFGAGRWTARAPAVRDEKTVATATKATATTVAHVEEAKHEAATQDVDRTEHVITRWLPAVPAKGGCPEVPAHVEQEVTRETHAASSRTAETHLASRVAITETADSAVNLAESHEATRSLGRPDWSATALVGGQLGGRRVLDALPAPLVVGVVLERRILGPVSVGAWATSGMAGGISLRIDW